MERQVMENLVKKIEQPPSFCPHKDLELEQREIQKVLDRITQDRTGCWIRQTCLQCYVENRDLEVH